MNIYIIAVGKLKEKFWRDASFEYEKRISAYCNLHIIELSDLDPSRCGKKIAAVKKEGYEILDAINKIKSRPHTILLDIAGKQKSSEELSSHIDTLAICGKSDIAFVIGGSFGVSSDVKAASNESISFGKITLPHNLARVVLLEQIYRAFKISRKEPYHK